MKQYEFQSVCVFLYKTNKILHETKQETTKYWQNNQKTNTKPHETTRNHTKPIFI